jgi:oligosaccharide repeat unit polymerase
MDYFFILFYLSFLAVFSYIVSKSGCNLLSINLLSVYFYTHFVYVYLGIGYIFLFNDHILKFANLDNIEIVWRMFLYNGLSLSILSASYIFSRYLFRTLSPYSSRLYERKTKFYFALFVVFLVCELTYLFYISSFSLDQIFLFNLDLEKADLDKIRSAMGADFQGKYHWYEAFMRGGLSYLLYCFFLLFLSNPSLKHRLLLYFILAATFVSFTSSGEKGAVINVIIGLLFCKLILQHRGRILLGITVKYILAIMVLLYFIFQIILNPDSDVIVALLYRLFIGFVEGLYYHLELIPSVLDFTLGSTFPNPAGLMPYEPVALARIIYEMKASQTGGVTGSFPTIFWAEAYANFGVVGVTLLSSFVGVYLGVYSRVFELFKFSISGMAFFVWSCIHYSTLAFGGLSWLFFDIKWFVVFAIFIIVYKFERRVGISICLHGREKI